MQNAGLSDRRESPESGERAASSAPERLGPYRVGKRIGAGGVGVVHRAIDTRTDGLAAIKIARHEGAEQRETIAREVQLLKRFRHPGIVQLYDHAIDADVPWYAMELLVGAPLRAVMKGPWLPTLPSRPKPSRGLIPCRAVQGPLLGQALRVVRDLCGALGYLHRSGFVHADVKPENVFLCRDGRTVLLDFGAAQPIDESGFAECSEWASFGTFQYMAPECCVGARYDHRADAYALGCVLHELVTGCTPAERALLLPAPAGDCAAALDAAPESLRAFIARLVARDAELRPRDLAGCEAELDVLVRQLEAELA
jgi:serine/threonine-protein kinase